MLFHASHGSSSFEKIIISSSDTGVFIIALSKGRIKNANLYMLTGTDVKEKWCEESLPETCTGEEILDSLIGFYCFTVCNTVCNIRPFKMLMN